jgi:hypothetical protein
MCWRRIMLRMCSIIFFAFIIYSMEAMSTCIVQNADIPFQEEYLILKTCISSSINKIKQNKSRTEGEKLVTEVRIFIDNAKKFYTLESVRVNFELRKRFYELLSLLSPICTEEKQSPVKVFSYAKMRKDIDQAIPSLL